MKIKLVPMKLKFLLFAFLTIVFQQSSFAQEEEGALQIKLDDEESNYAIYPVAENGFLLRNELSNTKRNTSSYNFTKYDTDLKKDKSYKINLLKKQTICFSKYVGGNYFYLVTGLDLNYSGGVGQTACKQFTCYRLDLTNMTAKTINVTTKTPFHIKDLTEMNGTILLSGISALSAKDLQTKICYWTFLCYIPLFFYKPEGHPVLIKLDFEKKTGNKKEIEFPNTSKVYTNILSVDYSDTLGNVDMLLFSHTKKVTRAYVKPVINDKAGKEIELKFPATKNITSGKIFTKSSTDKYVAGLVGDTKKRNSAKGTFATTNGVFLASIVGGKLIYNKINNFSDFKNFKFLSKNGEKLAKRREKKNRNLSVAITTTTHYITENENNVLVMGEAYFPTWRTETRYTTGANGQRVATTVTIFDGYQWLGGYVIAYDKNGKMLWENGMKLGRIIKSYSNNKRLSFAESDNGDIVITCALGDQIQTKTIHENGNADDDRFIDIKIADGGKKKANKRDNTFAAKIEPWYDNFYIAYNFQTIKKDKKEKGEKYSNYLNINKINMSND